MNPDDLAFGFLQYVVFLLSTTCHEAAHALVAKLGGDSTAADGGQVSLNPIPHIRREPFGMVVMPLIGVLTGRLIGWAGAPYNIRWALNYPKRAAWMALAGPAANFTLCILAALLMRIGLAVRYFQPGSYSMHQIVDASAHGGLAEGGAAILSIFFSLNLLLGCFNLIPFPPLDGYGVLGLFTSEEWAVRLEEMRLNMGSFSFLGLLAGWRLFSLIFDPLLNAGIDAMYIGYRLP